MFVLGVFFRGYRFVSKEYERTIVVTTKLRSELKKNLERQLADIKNLGDSLRKWKDLSEFLDSESLKNFLSRKDIDEFKNELSKIDATQQDAKDKLDKLCDKILQKLQQSK
jgi:Fe2+ transport system protein B